MDLTVAHVRLSDEIAPDRTAAWGMLVQRDRALIEAMTATCAANIKAMMMSRLSEQHQYMWQTLQALPRTRRR